MILALEIKEKYDKLRTISSFFLKEYDLSIYFFLYFLLFLDLMSYNNVCKILNNSENINLHYFGDQISCSEETDYSNIPSYYKNSVLGVCFENISFAFFGDNNKKFSNFEGEVKNLWYKYLIIYELDTIKLFENSIISIRQFSF